MSFEKPFWIGIFERKDGTNYEVARMVFGSEPKDYEVYDFILKHYHQLKYSLQIPIEEVVEKKINPKRLQRTINKEVGNRGIGTKAQQTISLQREASKLKKRKLRKDYKEVVKKRKFELKLQKKKKKHKGH
ncbi:YjdF family protein [Vallitalea okinawensis]|uniref:YjdF family protein n=1 Tax=Vallitalea okinawensis TaxID=2078660 RepID=UPI000CFC340B|nr:YjdF family protein [Vallitalea okinawensis]